MLLCVISLNVVVECDKVHTGQGKVGGVFHGLGILNLGLGILTSNMHSTYGYGSLLKITVKKDRKNRIEHPILYREVFIYYCLLPSYILVFY